MDTKVPEVGQRIYNLRRSRGYTREKLAELADISVQFLADIEKGKKNMTVTTLRKISSALSVTTDYIVNGTPEESDCTYMMSIFNALSPENKIHAQNLITVFAQAVNPNKSTE